MNSISFLKFSPVDMCLLILERERQRGKGGREEGGEREQEGEGREEKHQYEREISISCLIYMPWPRDWTRNLGMCPDQRMNPQPFGIQCSNQQSYPARAKLFVNFESSVEFTVCRHMNVIFSFLSITVDIQYCISFRCITKWFYNYVTYKVGNSSTDLAPYVVIITLLTIFPMLYFTSPWLFCNCS